MASKMSTRLFQILYKLSPYNTITNFLILYVVIFNVVKSEECKQISNCKCKFSNGSVIDLTSISSTNEARFKNITPILGGNYTYYFNPCYAFSVGTCSNVAVCQVLKGGKEYYDCGNIEGYFIWSSVSNTVHLMYPAKDGSRRTNVSLVCSEEAVTPKLEVLEEKPKTVYNMILTTRCACPDLCREDHLSAGSVLVILFLIFVSLYLVLGIIHSSLTRGAHGWELIPHYEFWADFPLLVRDGCVFVMSGCKADTAYERI